MSIISHIQARPTLADAPNAEELAAIECPVDRARRVSAVARQYGTLPGYLAELRRAALIRARQAGHTISYLACEIGLSKGRISQLTRTDADDSAVLAEGVA